MWNIATKILKTYITNYSMTHSPDIMRNKPEVTAGLTITMRKFILVSRRSYSMKSFCKLGIRTIWEQKQRMDSLRGKFLMNICGTSSDAILR
ncbi:unknown [[Clostridium] clostridioforme CAG:511]|nr:unknown [[Clostridium] clostridioforme CAG:511]